MDHVFQDLAGEEEQARRKAIEHNLIVHLRRADHSDGDMP